MCKPTAGHIKHDGANTRKGLGAAIEKGTPSTVVPCVECFSLRQVPLGRMGQTGRFELGPKRAAFPHHPE